MLVDATHSGSSVDFVPAAEDEAGLCVIHPEDRTRNEQRETYRQAGSQVGNCEEHVQPNGKLIQCFKERVGWD